MEADFARFDPDVADEFEKRSSSAYRAKIGGAVNWFTYDALYEYIGKYYGVIGNPSLAKDRQGFSLQSGVNLSDQNISVMASRYSDNVESDPLFPEIVSTQRKRLLPVQQDSLCSSGIYISENYSGKFKGTRRQYAYRYEHRYLFGQNWFHEGQLYRKFFAFLFANQRQDACGCRYDKHCLRPLCGLCPAFNLSIAPAFTWNKTRNHATNVWTDIFVYNLDFRSRFFHDRASFDWGGTYTSTKADNNCSWTAEHGTRGQPCLIDSMIT